MATTGERAAEAGLPCDHVDYECPGQHDDGGWSCPFCAGGLWACSVCGGFEGAMPTQCPGVRMSSSQSDSVYNGEQDFRRGQWVSEMSYYCPGGYFQALTEEEKRSIKGDSECPDNTPPTT